MLRSLLLFRNLAPRCRPACSCAASTPTPTMNPMNDKSEGDGGGGGDGAGHDHDGGDDHDHGHDHNHRRYHDWYTNRNRHQGQGSWRQRKLVIVAPLLGLSWLVTIKDLLGIEQFRTDDDPLKDLVKKAFISRKYGRYEEAIVSLQEALKMAQQKGEELPISRVYDELANTYYEMGKLDEAEELFRLLIHRMMQLHGKHESDPEFIGVSLKLADIFAQKGLLENAETGYRHCVTKQMKVMEEHLKKYVVAQGALVEHRHQVEAHGAAFTDPIALFGMCLEQYAYFLVNYRGEDRLAESEEYMDEVLKISYQIFGASSFHSVNLLNNFGAALILKHRYELARKYLSLGIDRILHIDECSNILPGYYCNYAEALFHCGKKEEALEYARKAVNLSRSEEPRVQEYARNFLQAMEKDVNKGKQGKSWLWFW